MLKSAEVLDLIRAEFAKRKVDASIEETPEEDGFTYVARSGEYRHRFEVTGEILADANPASSIRSRAYNAALELQEKINGTWKPPEER